MLDANAKRMIDDHLTRARTGSWAPPVPQAVLDQATAAGHGDFRAPIHSYVTIHDCGRCGAQLRYDLATDSWLGWALDYSCERVQRMPKEPRCH